LIERRTASIVERPSRNIIGKRIQRSIYLPKTATLARSWPSCTHTADCNDSTITLRKIRRML